MIVPSPKQIAVDAQRLVELYEETEMFLLVAVRDAVQASLSSSDPVARQRELNRLLDKAQARLNRVGRLIGDQAELVALGEYVTAIEDVFEEVAKTPPEVTASLVASSAAGETVEALRSQHLMVARQVRDVYQQVTATSVMAAEIGTETHVKAVQSALNRFADKGITSFVDKAGRKWSMDVYTDMAVRTMRNNVKQQGHLDGYRSAGVELVRASWHPASAPQCFPYQNQLLAITGDAGPRVMTDPATGETITVEVKERLDKAIANGYHHPNAILGGDQSIDTFAGTVGASKGTYCGPAFTIRTAQGNTATVSPEHPILTSSGWRTAESISVGDYLFSAVKGERSIPVIASESKLEKMPTTVENEFASFERNGTSISTPTAGYHFNDDRQFLQGEVHVVVPDDGLLPVPDAEIVKETGEVRFVWPDMGRGEAVGEGGLHPLFHGVAAPIGRALPNGDASLDKSALNSGGASAEHGGDLLAAKSALVEGDNFLNVDVLAGFDGRHPSGAETFADSRPGDSEHPADICAVVPGVVEADQVVSVEKIEFRGHAYDFQTELGFYALNGIVVHNCKHRDTAYTPGDPTPTVPQASEEENARQYEASQRQRQIERNIRKWKKRESVALDDSEARSAKSKVRQWQAEQRAHVNSHSYLTRLPHREQIRTGDRTAR